MSNSLWPHGLQHAMIICPLLYPRVCSNLCPLSQWYYPTTSFSVTFFSCLQSYPASEPLPMSQLCPSGGQSVGASASVLPMNIQGWFPLGLTDLIPFLPNGISRVISSTTKSIYSSALGLPYGPTLTSIPDYWKNYTFEYTDLCQQSDVSAFSYAI